MSNMIFASGTAHRHGFTPAWQANRTPKPRYIFRSGSISGRASYLADLDTETGGEVYQFHWDAAFREGLAALLPDRDDQPDNAADREAILAIMDENRSGQTVPEADAKRLAETWAAVKSHWPAMRELDRRSNLRDQLIPLYAMLHFCVGLENVTDRDGAPIVFEADALGKMSESVILRIDPDALIFAGRFAHNLQFGASAEKNSASPSNSEETQGASTAVTKARGASRRSRTTSRKSGSPKTRAV